MNMNNGKGAMIEHDRIRQDKTEQDTTGQDRTGQDGTEKRTDNRTGPRT